MTIKNQGSADAGPFHIGYYYGKIPAATTADVNSLWGCNFEKLAAGASVSCSGDIGVPASLAPGVYYLAAIADKSQIADSDRSNNVRVSDNGPITIGNTQGSITPGQTINLTGTLSLGGNSFQTSISLSWLFDSYLLILIGDDSKSVCAIGLVSDDWRNCSGNTITFNQFGSLGNTLVLGGSNKSVTAGTVSLTLSSSAVGAGATGTVRLTTSGGVYDGTFKGAVSAGLF